VKKIKIDTKVSPLYRKSSQKKFKFKMKNGELSTHEEFQLIPLPDQIDILIRKCILVLLIIGE